MIGRLLFCFCEVVGGYQLKTICKKQTSPSQRLTFSTPHKKTKLTKKQNSQSTNLTTSSSHPLILSPSHRLTASPPHKKLHIQDIR